MSFVVHRFSLAVAIGLALGVVMPEGVASAQQAPAGGGGGAAPAAGGAAPAGGGGATGGATTGTTTSSSTTTTQFFPGGVAPTPPGQPLGGGNTEFSSSRPITGAGRDTFDFGRGGGGGTAYGNPNGSFTLGSGNGEGGVRSVSRNGTHKVRKGDTLWGICDEYFQNPYQWPRVWSYNPQIQNPHWIYPGDDVQLRPGGGAMATEAAPSPSGRPTGGITDNRRQVPPGTVFLRNQGFIEEDELNWGEIDGSREDKMILMDFDEVYLRIASNRDLKIGQELTVYRPIRKVGGGRVVEIQGTVKVDQWNAKDHIGRAQIIESLDAIERGARVGPVDRRFEVVPPARNEKDVVASVLTSVTPHNIYGANQVLFIDKGEEDGLKPGNRLFVIRKGDGWHRSLPASSASKRIALEAESPAATETVPKPRNADKLPEEVVAELRVVSVKKRTSVAIVSSSRGEIETGDKAYARKGY